MNVKTLITALIALTLMAGCNNKKETTTTSAGNPIATGDVKSTISKQLDAANLGDVKVDVDQDKKLITLRGDVKDEASKARAEQIAKDNATTFAVANEIGVRPENAKGDAKEVSKDLDDAIEKDYKAALIAHHLNKYSVHYKSVNQVLEISGSVKSNSVRSQLEALAKDVPNVKEVVNKVKTK